MSERARPYRAHTSRLMAPKSRADAWLDAVDPPFSATLLLYPFVVCFLLRADIGLSVFVSTSDSFDGACVMSELLTQLRRGPVSYTNKTLQTILLE